jgi:tetratricopeptide (TPR) repeat protein
MIGLKSAIKNGAITLLGILLLSNIAVAQTSKLTRADALYKAGGYFEAIELYRDDIDKVKDKVELSKYLYKIGNCYRLIGNARQAELWYKKQSSENVPIPKCFSTTPKCLKWARSTTRPLSNTENTKFLHRSINLPILELSRVNWPNDGKKPHQDTKYKYAWYKH